MERPAPIPLTLLTGFLGAGKTTLLNRLLADPALADTLVIINEFGEVGLDHLFVGELDDKLVLLASGCLCCTIRDDLVVTLEELLRRRDNGRIASFARVVIETTGLADPAPIVNVLVNHRYLAMRFALDGIVTVVDAANGAATLDAHEEARRQVAVADRIVLTKRELVAQDATEALARRLRASNPGVAILPPDASAQALIGAGLSGIAARPELVAGWLAADAAAEAAGEPRDAGRDPNRHGDAIRAFALVAKEPVRRASFELFWTLLRSVHGPRLLRLKGLVALVEEPGRPLLVHAVQQVMQEPVLLAHWPDEDRRSRLVLIVKDIAPETVEKLWSAFLGRSGS